MIVSIIEKKSADVKGLKRFLRKIKKNVEKSANDNIHFYI